MRIETLAVGPLQSNCHIIYDENRGTALIVDPGDEPARILAFLNKKGLKTEYIICTHGHFDHIGGVPVIKAETGAKLMIHEADLEMYLGAKTHASVWGFSIAQPPRPDLFVKEGDELLIGDLSFKVLSTPGHSQGGICLYGEGILVTGDTLFAGSVGRTDLHGGSMGELKKSFARLMSLPPETRIYPGHGPSSTIREEWEFNFFVHEI